MIKPEEKEGSMRVEVSSIKDGLPERMGHTCANLNGELFFVWGGTDEKVAYLTSPNTHLWIYETLTGYCRHRSCSGECPPYLSGSTSCLIGQKMFVFGGHSTAHDNWLNSLYCLDLETFIWKDLGSQARAEPTKPIRSDKCVSWSYDERFYIFGGYGHSQVEHLLQLLDRQQDLQLTPDYRWPKFGWNNQLVEFRPRDNTWRWPQYTGKCPSARAAHSGALMGDKYYLFGGRDSRERLNDLYTLDMKTFEWNQIAVFSSLDPLERPIRHLLESSVSDGGEEDYRNEMLDDQMVEEIQEQDAPSPSASVQLDSEDSHDVGDESPLSKPLSNNLLQVNDDDEEEDDGSDYPFDYPHPSHLLERWSLSSHQSVTSSSQINNINCFEHQHLVQEQGNEVEHHNSNNILSPNPSYLYNGSLAPTSNSGQDVLANAQQQQRLSLADGDQDLAVAEILPASRDYEGIDEHLIGNEAPVPPGRSFSSFTPINNQDILLYGGVSSQDENLDDCWVFNIKFNRWTPVELKNKLPRLWHTGSRTKNNEVVIIGGSNSDKVDEFCSDIITVALEPKSLKRLALDTVARSIRMQMIARYKDLPTTICKLVKLRKQAMLLSRNSRGFQRSSQATT